MKKITALFLSLILAFSFALSVCAEENGTPYENGRFFETGDYKLHYRDFRAEGKPKGQIMLIHGFCLSTVSLEGMAKEYTSKGYRTVLVDVCNFGYSSRETSDTDFLPREELIGSLMTFLGGKWIVGGHSMGGGIAINLACDYPETVSGLVLFAPQTSGEVKGIVSGLMRSGIMQTVYNIILKFFLMFPETVRGFVEMSFSDSEYAKNYDLKRVTEPLSISGTGAGITIMASHTRGTDFEAFSALTIPCVIITAENDKVADKDNLARIIDNAPANTAIHNVTEGGHMMMEYNPSSVCALTMETVGRCF